MDTNTQLPKSRAEAILGKNDFYFTGVVCKNGHFSKRYTKHRSCFDCLSLKNKSNERKKYMSQYRYLNREKLKKLNKDWFNNNKEYYYNYQKEYREKNTEIVNKLSANRMKKYRRMNPEKIKAHEIMRRSADGRTTFKDIKRIIETQNYKCATCLCRIKDDYHADHIMPIKLGGSNFPSNIQILCKKCNLRKNAKHPIDWAKENGMLC